MATRIATRHPTAEHPFAAAWVVAKTLGVLCGPTVVPLWIATLLVEWTDHPLPTFDLALFVGSLGLFPSKKLTIRPLPHEALAREPPSATARQRRSARPGARVRVRG